MIRSGYELKSSTQMMKRRDHTPITGKKIKTPSTESNRIITKRQHQKTQRVSLIEKKSPQNNEFSTVQNNRQTQNRPALYELNRNVSNRQQSTYFSNKQNSSLLKSTLTRVNGSINESRTHSDTQNNPIPNTSMIISQVKQLGNKSVLIVKPNQFGMVNDSNLNQSRSTKRKVLDNQNKQNRFSLNKDNFSLRDSNKDGSQMKNSKVSNFFRLQNQNNVKNVSESENRMTKRNESNLLSNYSRTSQNLNGNKTTSSLSKVSSSNPMTKMRSNSTRVSRKQELVQSTNTSISKNYSYTSKGKWKC